VVTRLIIMALLGALAGAIPAAADWREDVGVLKIGMVAEAGAAYTRRQMEGFRGFIEGRTQLSTEIVPFPSYQALAGAQASGRVAYAMHTAFSYVDTAVRCGCVEPLAAPVSADGSTGFYALVVSAAGGDLTDLAGLRGRRLAVTGVDSVAGYLAPLHALGQHNIDPEADLGALIHAADPVDAVTMVFTDEVDAAVTWSSLSGESETGYAFGALTAMVASAELSMDEVRIIWQSPLIPFGPHVIRSELPPELKILLADALVSLAGEAPEILDAVDRSTYGGGGFRAISEDAYAFVASIVGGRVEAE